MFVFILLHLNKMFNLYFMVIDMPSDKHDFFIKLPDAFSHKKRAGICRPH